MKKRKLARKIKLSKLVKLNDKNCQFDADKFFIFGEVKMKKSTQSGFSLIELLLVVTIVGIIAAIGVPSFQKGIRAADNGAAFANLRTMSSVQISFYSQNGRFANLSELNTAHNNAFGTLNGGGTSLTRGKFSYEMSPLSPTPAQLNSEYMIVATEMATGGNTPYVFRLNQTGEIVQVTP